MRRITLTALGLLLLAAGCGNKMDLPTETPGGQIPFDGYFVYGVWENVGNVTDILVTQNQWIYVAEDSAVVSRLKRKGGNDNGVAVARVISTLEGFHAPVRLSEGAEDHIFVLDVDTATAVFYSDRFPNTPPSTVLPIPTTVAIPRVRLYDLYSQAITADWIDRKWLPQDSTNTFTGRDSARINHHFGNTLLTCLTADDDDNIYVGGRNFSYLLKVKREFDTTWVGTTPVLTQTGAESTYVDSTTEWFVRKYDAEGSFLIEVVSNGSGLGYGEEIEGLAWTPEALFFVDRATNRLKANDPNLSASGLDWLTGDEINDPGEAIPFLLNPSGVAVDPLGHIFVSDGGNGRVLKYTESFAYKERVDRNAVGLLAAPGAVAATDSLVYVYDEAGGKMVLFELPKPPE
ncbi:MAG: hypothetical protein JW958_05760 [Candidatus Eisenbacteria bacterium]|nr:hypothetical protein [Candidatus Eisenbacteria bacterium]